MISVGSAISVSGLVRGYGSGKNRVDVLQGLDMDVQSGSIYGLLGPSGCGKTTLLKVSLGFLSPESAVVSVPPDIPGSGVGYSPQEIALCRVPPAKPDAPSTVVLQAVKSGEVFTDRLNWWD